MRQLLLFLICWIASLLPARAQDAPTILPLADFYGLVLSNHPMVRQAELVMSSGDLEVMAAKGGFDPQLKSAYDGKRFDGKDYWKIWESSLRVPVWNGVDLKAGFSQSAGGELDPMFTTPSNGLSSIGISAPLGQGLLLDARRAVLRQAGFLRNMLQAEQKAMLNKLLLQVNKEYMDWLWRYRQRDLYREGMRLAAERLEAVRFNVYLGESPAIDSLEALIEFQNRKLLAIQAENDLLNSRLLLSNELWDGRGQPMELSDNIIPDTLLLAIEPSVPAPLGELLETATSVHYDLLKLDAKQGQLTIDRKWAAEKLRPKINLDYNFLSSGGRMYESPGSVAADWSEQYKIGMSFSTSLFLREERAKYGLAKIKSEQLRYETERRRREIMTDVSTIYNDLGLLRQQLAIQNEQVLNFAGLLNGESNRFKEGESSIFLMNVRENALINSKLKLAELQVKYSKSIAQLRWASGTFDRP